MQHSSRGVLATYKSFAICQLIMAITFLTTGIVVNFCQAVIYLTIRPFDPTLFRRINYYLTYMFNAHIVFLVEWWSASRAVMYADRDTVKEFFGKEHAVLVPNHGCEVDWLMGWTIGERVGVLGNARSYIKRILQYAPVLGWSWKLQEFILLDRNWDKDKLSIGPQLERLASYPDPIWLTLFAEGTRFTQEKYVASVKIAQEKGLPPLKHHLLPRTRGFVASIPHLRGKVGAIYDAVVAVDKSSQCAPSVYNLLKGREVKTVLLFRRIPLEQVPTDEKEAAAWLHKLFQEKDKVLDNYVKFGYFVPPEEKNNEEYKSYKNFTTFEIPRRPYTLMSTIAWLAITVIPLGSYLIKTVVSGSMLQILVVAGLIVAAHVAFDKVVGLAKVNTGSEYGAVKSHKKEL